jgi:hypothetical protein
MLETRERQNMGSLMSLYSRGVHIPAQRLEKSLRPSVCPSVQLKELKETLNRFLR